jgi:hypothetical protein
MNQERYHRIGQKQRTFIGNIRSRMARVRALRAINFEQFLDPEKTWMEDSPELVQLVEQCRDEKIAAALGRHPGQQSNIRFLGSLLKMVGLKHRGQKVKSEDGDYRVYRLDRDTLSDPDRRNALQCLDRRWENYIKKEVEVLDWEPILNPTPESQQAETVENIECQQVGGDSQQAKPTQSQSGQGFDPVPRTPTEYIYTLEASWNQSDPVESQGVGQPTEAIAGEPDPVAELVEAFPYCNTPQTFAAVIEQYSHESVEAAIALQLEPLRSQLRQWVHGQLSQSSESSGGELAQPGVSELTPIETLIRLFESCQSEVEFAEVSKFYEAPERRSPSQKEEFVEAAILYARSEIKPKWRKWWDSTLYEIRDFWRLLSQHESLSLEGS